MYLTIDSRDVSKIIIQYLKEYHNTLTPDQIEWLGNFLQCNNSSFSLRYTEKDILIRNKERLEADLYDIIFSHIAKQLESI